MDDDSQPIAGLSDIPKTFVIPPPPVPQLDQSQSSSDDDESENNHQSCRDWIYSSSMPHQSHLGKCTGYPKNNITIQYNRPCKTPICGGVRESSSPYSISVRSQDPVTLLTPTEQNVSQSGNNSGDYEDSNMANHYTLEPHPLETSDLSPASFNHQLSSSPIYIPSRSGSPADPRPSPEIMKLLYEFLRQHSNGHIMDRRPSNCSSNCSSSSGSDGSDINDSQDSSFSRCSDTDYTEDEEEEEEEKKAHDYSRMLLGQTPEPEEFDFDKAYNEEVARNARLHRTDSPVFYNGFPLMNRRG
ncbi:hypothetical protein BGZ76_001713 [Entomortierella beljakovae]|nr:hypothetical protein BGZ76_001713 [Entomortierella beljakovae]